MKPLSDSFLESYLVFSHQDLFDDYECLCEEGYFGRRCENAVNRCVPEPCQNGAECTNLITDYHCTCLEDFDVGINN